MLPAGQPEPGGLCCRHTGHDYARVTLIDFDVAMRPSGCGEALWSGRGQLLMAVLGPDAPGDSRGGSGQLSLGGLAEVLRVVSWALQCCQRNSRGQQSAAQPMRFATRLVCTSTPPPQLMFACCSSSSTRARSAVVTCWISISRLITELRSMIFLMTWAVLVR